MGARTTRRIRSLRPPCRDPRAAGPSVDRDVLWPLVFRWFPHLARQGDVDLLGVWNTEDTLRLQQNLLGHALQQRRQRTPATFFFALTEADSEAILSVDNASGGVVLELPGTKQREDVCPDLASFLDQLTPR